jgi:hypothetical protein
MNIIKRMLLKIIFCFNLIGFDVVKFMAFLKGIPFFISDFMILKKQMKFNSDFVFGTIYPTLNERNSEGGTMTGHYFHQDLLVAEKIFFANPIRHIDIGSRIDGFVAHVATYRKIEIFDIRFLESKVHNIIFTQADLMELPSEMKECCDSISSLHAIEHFGLGRYGDPIDIDGHIKAINNIHTMLKSGGKFYFSVPIGKQRIEFNSHRVFNLRYLISLFSEKFFIDNFNYVNDDGDLFVNAKLTIDSIRDNFNCKYGCGIFELTKM